MTPQKFVFEYEYQTYAEFYTDFKSVEIIGKNCTHKKIFAENLCKVSCVEEEKLQFCTLFCL